MKTLALALILTASAIAQDVKKEFEALDEKSDHAGIVALWKAHPGRVLSTIDSYLEGSLGLFEKSEGKPDDAVIKAMHARALRGAKAADEAFGTAIFGDYTASFSGFNDDEKKRFRSGQRAFGEGRKLMSSGDHEGALKSAKQCIDLAHPLGDWWGTAMGHGLAGAALEQLGKKDEALTAYSTARLLEHDLRLDRSELRSVTNVARLALELGKTARAAQAIDNGLELAKAQNSEKATKTLQEMRETLAQGSIPK